jgi:hypothetical protein
MDAAFSQIVATLLQLGFPGVVIVGLAWWIYKQQERINGLTDKLMTVTEQATKASGEMAAAMNRLTDTLIRGKPE